MIICGFAGVGKSTLCKNKGNFIDLESTPFEKDWDRYIKVATHMDKQGYNVMISCHESLRKELHNRGIKYKVAMPFKELKDEYIGRYIRRGNTPEFIANMEKNWDNYVTPYYWEDVILLHRNEFLGDMF